MSIEEAFAHSSEKRIQIRREKLDILARPIFENKGEPTGSTHARDGGRRKIKSNPFRKLAELSVHTRFDFLKLFLPAFAIVPRLKGYEKESVVTRTGEAEQAEAKDAGCRLHSRQVRQDVFDFPCNQIRSFEGRGTRQLQIDIEVSLIFVWQKAGWNFTAEESRPSAENHQQNYGDGSLANESSANSDVAVGRALEYVIEPIKEPSQ